ncbi:hypothetical protein F2P81_016143 [Scophthalmus maximus]|uniref:Uncharacterized protein n=1 Tax=Scophthalmus maximus TaxID=52904 RepID=A0A6A4SHA0_SCOMX|nr:hypothetical protein F2P81_016143 [Scophthalmus maximus]
MFQWMQPPPMKGKYYKKQQLSLLLNRISIQFPRFHCCPESAMLWSLQFVCAGAMRAAWSLQVQESNENKQIIIFIISSSSEYELCIVILYYVHVHSEFDEQAIHESPFMCCADITSLNPHKSTLHNAINRSTTLKFKHFGGVAGTMASFSQMALLLQLALNSPWSEKQRRAAWSLQVQESNENKQIIIFIISSSSEYELCIVILYYVHVHSEFDEQAIHESPFMCCADITSLNPHKSTLHNAINRSTTLKFKHFADGSVWRVVLQRRDRGASIRCDSSVFSVPFASRSKIVVKGCNR